VNGSVPETATLKIAEPPAMTVWLVGWMVMVGGLCAHRFAAHTVRVAPAKANDFRFIKVPFITFKLGVIHYFPLITRRNEDESFKKMQKYFKGDITATSLAPFVDETTADQ
jgi:hypothetical protein